MPVISIAAEDAWEYMHGSGRRYDNLYGAAWWNNGNDEKGYTADSMVRRIKESIFYPGTPSHPLISQDSKVFAIGSCFARRIEYALMDRGIAVLSDGTGISNKYTTPTILQELRWAFDSVAPFTERMLIALRSGNWGDLHLHLHGGTYERGFPTLHEAMALHRSVTDSFLRLPECPIVIITLGLVEAWFDSELGIYVNDTPTPDLVRFYPGRFRFDVLDFHENWKNLEEIYEILQNICHRDYRIIVTVSPIPLTATFTQQRDVQVATTYSKSMLRVLAEDWAWRHRDRVIYFPSYEMAMNSRRDLVWESDQVHVQGNFAKHIVDYFWQLYSCT